MTTHKEFLERLEKTRKLVELIQAEEAQLSWLGSLHKFPVPAELRAAMQSLWHMTERVRIGHLKWGR